MLLEIVVGQFKDGGCVVVPEKLDKLVAGPSRSLQVNFEPFLAFKGVNLRLESDDPF